MSGYALPYKGWSQADAGAGTTLSPYTGFGGTAVPLPVYAKKAFFATPYHELPTSSEDSVWAQHLGQVTYFIPGVSVEPAWVSTYLKFSDNFIGQQVKIVMANSADNNLVVMHDWDTVAFTNGSFQPIFQDSTLTNLVAGVTYWIEVLFNTTINKAPGFYGSDGIEGFLSTYWWSISQAPVDDIYKDQAPTELDPDFT